MASLDSRDPSAQAHQQQGMPPAENGSAANGHPYGVAADTSTVLHALRTVKQCQQRRVQQYTAFNSSFRQYMESKDEAPYRQAMVEATRVFAEVNQAVRDQERRLREDLHEEALANSLSSLQKGEEAKLRFTLIQQALKKSGSDGRFSWQSNAEGPDLSATTEPAAASPGFGGGHHAEGNGHSYCGAVAEPTEQEFNNALAEATQELQAAVTGINDILMELQEAEENILDEY